MKSGCFHSGAAFVANMVKSYVRLCYAASMEVIKGYETKSIWKNMLSQLRRGIVLYVRSFVRMTS